MILNWIFRNIFSGDALRRCSFLLIFLFFIASNLFSASLRLTLDRNRIYLGESIVASVKVNGSNDEGLRPVFTGSFDAKVEYLGSRNQSQTTVSIVNGRMTRNEFKGRTFVYQITPSTAGSFDTGKVVLNLPDGQIECPGAAFEVVGVESRPDIEALILCTNRTILVDSPFTISLSILLRSLPKPNEAVEPVWADNPLHVQADFLSFQEIDGLKSPDPNAALGKFIRNGDRRGAYFTINDYVERGFGSSFFSFNADPFKEIPIKFRMTPEAIDRNGTNWWRYTMDFEYFPKEEGDYTFGPVSVKGAIITGANADGSARMANVFVIGPAITVHVIPPPEEGRPEWFCGGVGRSLNLKASLDAMRCKVGDPLALTLEMTGDISADNIRPPVLNLQSSLPEDFRIYDDVIESESITNGKRFRYRIRPLKAGTLEFPAIKAAYYDTAKGNYVTIKSAPLPIQVEVTTQIAAESNGDTGSDDDSFIPNGIILSPVEESRAFIPFARHLSFAIGPFNTASHLEWWLLPALWLILIIVRMAICMVRRYRELTRFGRLAAIELRAFRLASRRIKGADDQLVLKAISAVRAFVAASLSSESRALTSREMRSLFVERKLTEAFINSFTQDFATLELIPYRKEGEGERGSSEDLSALLSRIEKSMCALPDELSLASRSHSDSDWRSYGAILLVFFISLSSAFGGIFERPPSAFDWERASSAVETARFPEDFEIAANLYYAMVTNGYSSGPLFYNLGTTMLLAERPRAAAQALDIAARWRGMSPEVLDNRLAAEKLITSSAQLPPERYFFIWHYGLPIQIRIAALQLYWNLLWLFLLLMSIIAFWRGGRADGKQSKVARLVNGLFSLSATFAVIFGIILFHFAISVGISYKQAKSSPRIPAWELELSQTEEVAAEPVAVDGGNQ